MTETVRQLHVRLNFEQGYYSDRLRSASLTAGYDPVVALRVARVQYADAVYDLDLDAALEKCGAAVYLGKQYSAELRDSDYVYTTGGPHGLRYGAESLCASIESSLRIGASSADRAALKMRDDHDVRVEAQRRRDLATSKAMDCAHSRAFQELAVAMRLREIVPDASDLRTIEV